MAEPVTPHHPPSLLEFVKLNQPLNPHMTVPELAQVWNTDWGHVDPKTLPSLQSFMEKNKPLNPEMSDDDLSNHWHDYYGSLGADGPSPKVMNSAGGTPAHPVTTRKNLTRGLLNTTTKAAPPPGTDFSPPTFPLFSPLDDDDPEPDDVLPTVEAVQRWIDAGDDPYGRLYRLDYIDKGLLPPSPEMIAEAERQRNIPQYRAPNASNARAKGRKPSASSAVSPAVEPRSEVPSLDEFLSVVGPKNPHLSTGDLSKYWNENYGHVDPKTLPSLETFLPVMKEKNPDLHESELAQHWRDRYGALGAPEKNPLVAGAVTNVPKMTGQATAARTRQ